MDNFELVIEAMKARRGAYAPYSNHGVGAALELSDGRIVTGCNIENAAYTPSNCAERTAIFKAVSEGCRDFKRIAVVGGMNDSDHLDLCAPCGVCRQVMMEFVDPASFEIVLAAVDGALSVDTITRDKVQITVCTLQDLLPYGFGPANMNLEI